MVFKEPKKRYVAEIGGHYYYYYTKKDVLLAAKKSGATPYFSKGGTLTKITKKHRRPSGWGSLI